MLKLDMAKLLNTELIRYEAKKIKFMQVCENEEIKL